MVKNSECRPPASDTKHPFARLARTGAPQARGGAHQDGGPDLKTRAIATNLRGKPDPASARSTPRTGILCGLVAVLIIGVKPGPGRGQEHPEYDADDDQVEDHLRGHDAAGGIGRRGDVAEANG